MRFNPNIDFSKNGDVPKKHISTNKKLSQITDIDQQIQIQMVY